MSVADRISSLTPEQKALLELLRKKKSRAAGGQVHPPPPVPRRSGPTGEGDWPLSMDQERLWFMQQLEPGSTALNIAAATRMLGALELPAIHGALNEIVHRHAAWRTSFPVADGWPVQRVVPHRDQEVSLIDLASLPEAVREPEMQRVLVAGNGEPFDLERGPLVRVLLVKLGPEEHACLLTVHHLATDWLSSQIVWRELAALYDAALARRPSPLAEPPVHYSDYAAWQRDWLQGEVLEDLMGYWQRQLVDFPLTLELPTDRPRQAVPQMRGGAHSLETSRELAEGLRGLARREGATLFMTVLALVYALLHRFSGQERIILGANNANRNRPELEPVIGYFLTQIPFAVDLTGDPSFRELLRRVRKVALEAYSHQDLPFGKLVELLQPDRGSGRPPVIQALVQLLDGQYNDSSLTGIEGEAIALFDGNARYDLMLGLYDYADGVIEGTLEYDAGVFDATTTARLIERFLALGEAAVFDPEVRLSRLPSLSAAARHQVLTEWNDVPAPAGVANAGGWTVPERFAAQAARTPEAVALVFGGEPVTYGELDRWAAALARRLRALGIGPEARVALLADRSPALVAALLAVWKAGGACVPLDPTAPAERLAGLLADAEPAVLIHERELGDGLLPSGTQTLRLGDEAAATDAAEGGEAAGPRGDDLAYLIYTSGTTGRPKAVMVEHGSLAATLGSLIGRFGFGPDDRMPHLARFSFDIALFELLAPLLSGGACELLNGDEVLEMSSLLSAVERATRVHAVPNLMRHLAAAGGRRGSGAFSRLRTLFTGGDVVSPDLVAELQMVFPRADVVALYGPTEATIVCTAWPVPLGDRSDRTGTERVLIGRPLDGVHVRVADRYGEPVFLGAPGELWVSGPGVARGYFRREELTAERFVERGGCRFYRTGDLVRQLPIAGGALEFLGRTDLQVKVSGFRVEPGEIEAALLSHPAVQGAVVVARDDGWGDKRLVAYCVPAGPPEECDATALRPYLAGRLPGYMVPSLFEILPELPLTSHGKVDRERLPAPVAGRQDETPDEAPRTPAEELVAAVWADLLGLPAVGRSANFFDLGGHSLLATRVVTRLREGLGVDLPVRSLFQAPTVEAFARELEAASGSDESNLPLVPIPRDEDLPLSFAQERLWFIDRLNPGAAAYNIPLALEIEGDLSPTALAAALGGIVQRHEVLRTIFGECDRRPVQVIAAPPSPELPWRLPLVDLSAAGGDAEARRLAGEEVARPFDLECGPVLRSALLRLEPFRHVLLLDIHHIASDGWSMGVMTTEIAALYAAAAVGLPSPLPELPVQYADFAVWQRRRLAGDGMERQLGYWREQLQGAPVLELPTDRPRPAVQSFRGATRMLPLDAGVVRGLAALARRLDATLFMVVLAAFQALLSRYTGQEDVVVGSPIANRNRAELEPLIGFFVNSLVLRGDLSGDPTFAELVARSRRTALDAYSHQDLPFDRLVEELRPERRLSHNPLFQVVVGVQNTPAGRADLPGLSFSMVEVDSPVSRFDLEVMFWQTEESMVVQLTHATDLFDTVTVDRLALHLETLLKGVLADPARRLSELPLLGDGERHQLLAEWNDTAAELPEATLADLFREQAARYPGAPAISSSAGGLTFAELDVCSDRLARRLVAAGAGPEVTVAILTEHTPVLVVGLLGIVKAGSAYLPLDPAYPAERLAWMLADAGASILLGSPERLSALPEEARVPVTIGLTPAPEPLDGDEGELPAGPLPDSLAYLIYTSGSTGRPKGVGVTHRNVVRLVRRSGFAELGPDEVFLHLAPTSFDASTLEIWAPLLNGGRLVLPGTERASLAEIGTAIERWGVTTLWLTAGLFHSMVDERLEALRPLQQLLAGGDVLSPSHVRRAVEGLPGCAVINGYGPTEGTTFTTCHRVEGEVGATVPIGRPVGNTRVHVLDRRLRPVPVGVWGELYAGGGGLARGYVGRPDLTAERFVPDPLGLEPGARLYRTGDLARHRGDGRLEFLGRRDGQVKLRGYRIELGEIESALARHPGVLQAAVTARDDGGPVGRRLVAYVVGEVDAAELRRFLLTTLPDFMVPSAFVSLEALPLTPNGKVDRASLPAPERIGGEDYVAPSSPLEELLVGAAAELLGLERVGMRDNFFALGGHSLLATQLVSRLSQEHRLDVTLQMVFESQDLTGLADRIVERQLAGLEGEDLDEMLRRMEAEME